MSNLEALLSRYDYHLPTSSIALTPASPRDSSKLLVYSKKSDHVDIDSFLHLSDYIPKDSLLIFNDTKVIPARLPAYLPSGRKVELLCTKFDKNIISALCERFLPKGLNLKVTKKISAEVLDKIGSEYTLRLLGASDIRPILRTLGSTPLPPYLKHSPLSESERRNKYQAIFARRTGSIAAPTASLHFTPRVLRKLKSIGVDSAYVTLHVNLGTFMPLTEQALESNTLHEEFFEIPDETLTKIHEAKKVGKPVIAVGTTALRALESAFLGHKNSTRLFIRDGFTFKVVDGLITNFHVPRSSLLMLVSALIGREKLLELYEIAKKNNFRFFSFGDAMLIV
jgi:S-adenosylmethionine:tRNA ribosyltransferase-isomerase